MSTVEIQLKFLLDQAPMINVPAKGTDNGELASRFAASRATYAYVHPKTFARLAPWWDKVSLLVKFAGSPTKWVLTELMPEERVIYAATPMPGVEGA